jgi:cytochrome P450
MAGGYLEFATELFERYGDSVRYRIGVPGVLGLPIYQFTHPQQIYDVLVKHAKSFAKTKRSREVYSRWIGEGLFLNEGASWASQRRLVAPAFHPHRLLSYVDIVNRQTDALIAAALGRSADLAALLNRLTLLTSAEALFGTEVSAYADRFLEEVNVLHRLAMRDFTRVVVWPLWWPGKERARMRKAIGFLDDLVKTIIQRRRAQPEDQGDLLSMLLLAVDEETGRGGMTDQQVRDEAMNLILGSNETTAASLTWTLLLLLKHPDILRRAQEEVDRVLEGRMPAGEDVPRLELLQMSLKESMRLYPVAYAASREAVEPVEIGGEVIPRGAQVQLIYYITHRDPRWFSDSLEFRPERFAEGREGEIPRGAYNPFGAGPRACVGRGLATMEAVLVLARLLQCCHIELDPAYPEPLPDQQVSLVARGGLHLRMEARH